MLPFFSNLEVIPTFEICPTPSLSNIQIKRYL